jgi:hypothetical protein
MDWQLVAVAAFIGVAAVYVARRTWRTWSGGKTGCAGCSCATKTESTGPVQTVQIIPQSELLRRVRGR